MGRRDVEDGGFGLLEGVGDEASLLIATIYNEVGRNNKGASGLIPERVGKSLDLLRQFLN